MLPIPSHQRRAGRFRVHMHASTQLRLLKNAFKQLKTLEKLRCKTFPVCGIRYPVLLGADSRIRDERGILFRVVLLFIYKCICKKQLHYSCFPYINLGIYKCICKKQLNYSCFPYINLVTSKRPVTSDPRPGSEKCSGSVLQDTNKCVSALMSRFRWHNG